MPTPEQLEAVGIRPVDFRRCPPRIQRWIEHALVTSFHNVESLKPDEPRDVEAVGEGKVLRLAEDADSE